MQFGAKDIHPSLGVYPTMIKYANNAAKTHKTSKVST